jgi:hypothetical protein
MLSDNKEIRLNLAECVNEKVKNGAIFHKLEGKITFVMTNKKINKLYFKQEDNGFRQEAGS